MNWKTVFSKGKGGHRLGLLGLLALFASVSSGLLTTTVTAAEDPQIRIVHLAPFSNTDAAVDILIDGTIAAGNKTYGQSTLYFAQPGGDITMSVELVSDQSELVSQTFTLVEATSYTFTVVGDGVNQPLQIIQTADDNSTPAAGKFKLRVGHLAPFANTLAATTVDVRYDDGTVVLDNVAFGAISEFIELDEGSYDLQITTPDGLNTLIDIAPRGFTAGDIVTIYATGEGANQDLGAVMYPSNWYAFGLGLEVFIPPARVYLANLAPFNFGNTSLSILLNNNLFYDNLAYGETVGYLEVNAGSYDVDVYPTGSNSALISDQTSFEPGQDYTLLITGDGANQTVEIVNLADNLDAPSGGKFKLRLGHLAPFASAANSTAVDVRLQDGTPVLEQVSYGDIDSYVELDAGEYDLQITTVGGDTTILDVVPMTFSAGEIVSLFAAGGSHGQEIGLFAVINSAPGTFVSRPAYIRVIHLAPFAADEAATATTVSLDGEPLVSDITNGELTDYIPVVPGSKQIEIRPNSVSSPAIIETETFSADQKYTILINGDDSNRSLDALVLNDTGLGVDSPVSNLALLRFVHIAPFLETFADLAVDIRYDTGKILFSNVNYQELTGFVPLVPGTYNFVVTEPGSGETLFDLRPFEILGNDVATIYLIGDDSNEPLQAKLTYENGRQDSVVTQTTTRVYVSHLAPFDIAANTAVSVTLQPETGAPVVLPNLTYGTSVPYSVLPSGTYTVSVTPAGASSPVVVDTATFDLGKDYTVAVVGDGSNRPLALVVADDDNDPPASGKGHIRLGHLAPFAATLAETTADIRLQNGDLLLGDVPFGTIATTYLELNAGTYDVKITTPGGVTTLIDPLPVELAAGDVVSLFAVGGINETVDVYAITDPANDSGVFVGLAANLYVAHLAPFANGDAAVVVSIDGDDTLVNFGYGDSTGYLAIPAGERAVEITPIGATSPAISATTTFTQGVDFTAIAVGDGTNQPLDLKVLVDNNAAPSAGNAKVRIVHLAPFASGLNDTVVDVRLQNGTLLQTGVKFGDLADYLQLPAGDYDLKITTVGGDTTLINPPSISIAAGDVVTVIATGDNNNQDLQIYTIYNGNEGSFVEMLKVFLPMIYR